MAILEALKGVAGQHLLYAAGLWALLALIPLIIVYLIRPRPKKQTIPALMFLMTESARSDKSSFLRRFIRDPLFLFQILLIIAFAIAMAKPFMTVTEELLAEKTIFVIDASASSQVMLDGQSRFDRAIEFANDNTGSKNTIILASSVPELIADNIDSQKAKDELAHLKPRDTPTNLFDTIVFAGNYAADKDRVFVISDFIETGTQKNVNAAKDILQSKGAIASFINIRDKEPRRPGNVGIIDLEVTEDQTTVQIKNFNADNESIDLSLEGANLTVKHLLIEPKGVEVVTFPTPPSLSKFSITPTEGHDDFPLDNDAYISTPSKKAAPLLLISNSVTKHLSTALSVIDTIAVDRGTPPKVPDINHQIIMMSNVNKDLILPGTIKNIRKKVDEGAALIIIAQPDVLAIDFEGLLPVERAENSGPVLIQEDQYIVAAQDTTLTQDINFGKATKYLKVKPFSGATTIATTTNNVSMIVLKNHGKGMVVYFGMMDEYSDFKLDIYYPVFWKRLFDMAIRKQDLSELNFKTGRLLNLLTEQKLMTPFGKVTADTILLSHQGIYSSEEKNFVANLLNEEESNINGEGAGDKIGAFDEGAKIGEKVPFELTRYFIIGLLALVFIELLWIKFRGDL